MDALSGAKLGALCSFAHCLGLQAGTCVRASMRLCTRVPACLCVHAHNRQGPEEGLVCRSAGKSNTFKMPTDLAQIHSASQKGSTADPLRITVSKYDKSQQHQPPPEDDNGYDSPDNRHLQVRRALQSALCNSGMSCILASTAPPAIRGRQRLRQHRQQAPAGAQRAA